MGDTDKTKTTRDAALEAITLMDSTSILLQSLAFDDVGRDVIAGILYRTAMSMAAMFLNMGFSWGEAEKAGERVEGEVQKIIDKHAAAEDKLTIN